MSLSILKPELPSAMLSSTPTPATIIVFITEAHQSINAEDWKTVLQCLQGALKVEACWQTGSIWQLSVDGTTGT